MEMESGWFPSAAAAARRVMNQTMETCVEVNLYVNEAVLIQTVLVKMEEGKNNGNRCRFSTAPQNIRGNSM